jgi:serine/threonine-protein kinase
LVGGKYRISRFLAQGGMGVVYEAQHAIVKRRFAVKFLRSDYARRREFLGRFQREAEAAGALESEHIASAVDFGIAADGSPYLVMEYLVGEDLASLLVREARLPLERAADLCVQACHGADAAHVAGILHRDLKPKNLFIGRREDGTDLLKILDFGIAKLSPIRQDNTTTDTGTVMGTPAYMSPEQSRGERALDPRSDVYALGAILYEMLSGQLPHPGDSPNAILHHISTRPGISLAVVAPGLPMALVETVDRTLATDPGVRPQSAMALALSLAPFAKRQVWPEWPGRESATSQAGESPAPSVAPSPARAGAANPARRRRGALLAATAALVAGLVAAAVLWSRSPKTEPKSMDIPPPTHTEPLSAGAEPTLRPAMAEPVSPPSLGVVPAPPSPPVVVGQGQATTKPSPAKRARASGRPSGRPIERPAEPSVQSAPVGPIPAPQSAKGSMPRPIIDRNDPYPNP